MWHVWCVGPRRARRPASAAAPFSRAPGRSAAATGSRAWWDALRTTLTTAEKRRHVQLLAPGPAPSVWTAIRSKLSAARPLRSIAPHPLRDLLTLLLKTTRLKATTKHCSLLSVHACPACNRHILLRPWTCWVALAVRRADASAKRAQGRLMTTHATPPRSCELSDEPSETSAGKHAAARSRGQRRPAQKPRRVCDPRTSTELPRPGTARPGRSSAAAALGPAAAAMRGRRHGPGAVSPCCGALQDDHARALLRRSK